MWLRPKGVAVAAAFDVSAMTTGVWYFAMRACGVDPTFGYAVTVFGCAFGFLLLLGLDS